MEVIKRRAFARVGLIGNPSDGYGGKTIAFTIPNYYADVVLYDGDPLDPRTRVLRVWIDGELQFDREESRAFF